MMNEPTVQQAVGHCIALTHQSKKESCTRQLTKKLLLFCLVLMGNMYAFANAQNVEDTKVTIGCSNQTLDQALQLLKNAAGVRLYYMTADVQPYKEVTLEKKTRTVKETLELLLKNTSLTYKVMEDRIVFTNTKKNALIEAAAPVVADTVTLRGRVTSEDGKPLEGVAVQVKNTNKGTITNSNGEFRIAAGGVPATLLFSFVGYEKKLQTINDINGVVVALKADKVSLLENVDVYSTGYQVIPKERATGSFAIVNNELFNRSVSTNVLDRIYEVASGLVYDQRNISPDQNKSAITIRGVSTINANARPLVVVDGFPYDEGNSTSSISNLNPNDIESVTILKDAAAASIWGARSGNGVIVITTKRGRFNQKPSIQFNSNINFVKKPDVNYIPTISSSDYVNVEKTLFANGFYNASLNNTFSFPVLSSGVEILAKRRSGLITADDSARLIAALQGYNIKQDISDNLLQTSLNQQYAINVRGGSASVSYYGSIGYDKNRLEGVGDEYDRVTLRFDNIYRPIRNLDVNTFITYVQENNKNNSLPYSSFMPTGSVTSAPYTKLVDVQGNPVAIPYMYRQAYVDTAKYPALLDWHYRPLDEMKSSSKSAKSTDIRIGAGLKYTFLPGLSADIKYQYQRIVNDARNQYSQATFFTRDLINKYMYRSGGRDTFPIPLGSILDLTTSEVKSYNVRGQINFNHRWSEHDLNAIVGGEIREMKTLVDGNRKYGYDDQNNVYATQLNYGRFYSLRPGSSAMTIPYGGIIGNTLYRYLSYFGNAAYTYVNKYTVSASGRIDGSNLFGVKANQKITPLWSIGAAWDISQESFYKNFFLPYLKLRATYGYNGNTNNGNAFPTAIYGTVNGLTPEPFATIGSPGNPQLRWEKVRMINLGLDFASKGRRIDGTIEYYTKKGIDLVGDIDIDATTGFVSYIGNKASTVGHGVDITINTLNVNSIFKWSSSVLFSYTTDKVVAYDKSAQTVSSYIGGNAPIIGKPLNYMYSYRWGGLNPSNGDPRGYVADTISVYSMVPNNAKLTDLVYSGSTIPRFFGAFRNTFSYRNFALSVNIFYKLNYVFRRNSINYTNLFNNWGGHSDFRNRWQQKGDELRTSVPSMPLSTISARDAFYSQSEILVEKGDHIRLRDIRISYDFNKAVFRKLPFQSAQLYVYLNNVGILWRANKQNIDPDYGDNRIPPSRSLAIGLNVNF
jgi:TonB-linked SusC/RagA family outer membrane protein